MFQDIGVSKTLIAEYEQYCETQHVVNTGKIAFVDAAVSNVLL